MESVSGCADARSSAPRVKRVCFGVCGKNRNIDPLASIHHVIILFLRCDITPRIHTHWCRASGQHPDLSHLMPCDVPCRLFIWAAAESLCRPGKHSRAETFPPSGGASFKQRGLRQHLSKVWIGRGSRFQAAGGGCQMSGQDKVVRAEWMMGCSLQRSFSVINCL